MPLFYHTFIHITYYIPNNKAGDHASSNELLDNLPFILKLNIYQKADFLLYELIWKTQYFLITYSVHTLNLTWFLKGLCHGLLVHFVYRWQVHVLIRYETWEIDACERQNPGKIAALSPSNMSPKHYITRYKQQNWTLKNCWANKFSKTTIAVCFNLLHICASVLSLLFDMSFIPSFNVLSGYFDGSLNLVAVPIVWVLINFLIQLL